MALLATLSQLFLQFLHLINTLLPQLFFIQLLLHQLLNPIIFSFHLLSPHLLDLHLLNVLLRFNQEIDPDSQEDCQCNQNQAEQNGDPVQEAVLQGIVLVLVSPCGCPDDGDEHMVDNLYGTNHYTHNHCDLVDPAEEDHNGYQVDPCRDPVQQEKDDLDLSHEVEHSIVHDSRSERGHEHDINEEQEGNDHEDLEDPQDLLLKVDPLPELLLLFLSPHGNIT